VDVADVNEYLKSSNADFLMVTGNNRRETNDEKCSIIYAQQGCFPGDVFVVCL
jgi:hypothetical protein